MKSSKTRLSKSRGKNISPRKRLSIVEIEVNPLEPDGKLCWPDPAKAVHPHVETRFRFTLSDRANWKWIGYSPVVSKGPKTQFPDESSIDSQGRVILDDVNSDNGMYKYTVTVEHKRTHQLVEIDPFIQNQ